MLAVFSCFQDLLVSEPHCLLDIQLVCVQIVSDDLLSLFKSQFSL